MSRSTGKRELFAIDGDRGAVTEARLRRTSPLLANNLLDHAFGSVFRQTTLSQREREMASIAILGAMGGADPQLQLHIEAALRVGADPDEIVALAEHLSVYAGYPRAINMLDRIRSVFDEVEIAPALPIRSLWLGDHYTTVVDTGGEKPVLVLVHALGLDWRMWRGVIRELASDFRVIAYDLRGFGQAVEAPMAKGLTSYAADLVRLIEGLGEGVAHVVGLSLGGSIAHHLAIERPDLFASLTIIAATAWSFDAFAGRADAARSRGLAAQVVPSLTRWFRPSDLAADGWAVRYARDCVIRADPDGWCAGWDALHQIATADRLTEIRIPSHIIAGEWDASTPPALMEGFRAIPSSTFRVIPEAPHMLALTHDGDLARSVKETILAV